MNMFQILSPSSFIQAGYDPWKLLPRDEEEEMLYTDCSKQSMLRILLDYPTWNLKWNLQVCVVILKCYKVSLKES